MPEITETSRAGRRTAAGIGLVGVLLAAGAVALVLNDGPRDHRAVNAIVHGLGIALPIGLGLFRLSRRGTDRFAWLLVGTGLLWSLITLAESSASVPYSVGRIAVWRVEPTLVILMLAFPFGRLETIYERRLAQAAVVLAATMYLPTALLAQFPEPAPWASCGTSCPTNAFVLTDQDPAWVGELVRPVREVLAVLIYAAVAVVLFQRTRRAASLMRHVLAPIAAVAAYRAGALLAYLVGRIAGADGTFLEIVGWLYMLTLPIVAASFALGLLSQRLFVADALERVAHELREHSDADGLRQALRTALADPSLSLVYWLRGQGGRWVDEAGWPTSAPERAPGRAVTEVRVDGRRLAAIRHDSGLDPLVVQAAGAHALTTLENDRLIGELQSSLDELGRSRARIAAVADRERRKIERDLHDGAQQRLVALRIKLELIAEGLDGESPESAAALRRLEGDVETTIDEVRSFARGLYPPVRAQRRLGGAVWVGGRIARMPTTSGAQDIRVWRPEVEATVYFACLEALQNAAKHARGATGVAIRVVENGGLRFEVHDDGQGFIVPTVLNGNGLTNLRDRVAAIGGEVKVRSAPGQGTTVAGVVPV